MKIIPTLKVAIAVCIGLMPSTSIAQETAEPTLKKALLSAYILACQEGDDISIMGFYLDNEEPLDPAKNAGVFATMTTLTKSEEDQMVFSYDGDALINSTNGKVTIFHEDKMTEVTRNSNETRICRLINTDLEEILTGYERLAQGDQ